MNASISRWTNSAGENRLGGLDRGLCTVTPTDARQLFDPTERLVTLAAGDLLGEGLAAMLVDRNADGIHDGEDNGVDTPNPDRANEDGDDHGNSRDRESWNPSEPPGTADDGVRVTRNAGRLPPRRDGRLLDDGVLPAVLLHRPRPAGCGAGFTYNHACLVRIRGWTTSFVDA